MAMHENMSCVSSFSYKLHTNMEKDFILGGVVSRLISTLALSPYKPVFKAEFYLVSA